MKVDLNKLKRNTGILIFFAIIASAFTFKPVSDTDSNPIKVKDSALCDQSICTYSALNINTERLCDSLYDAIFSENKTLDKKVFTYALKGYLYLLKQGVNMKKDTLTVVDYSLSANIRRMWVLDLKNRIVLFHELVAHGKNSGNEYAKNFSNSTNSLKTSLGFFLTGGIYDGRHDQSIKLFGIEHKFNSNAFERGIVIHGAKYVSETFINQNQRLGRSLGCPAVSENVISEISKVISNGSCFFAYYPNKTYLKNSKLLKG